MKWPKVVRLVLALSTALVGCTSADITNNIHFLEQRPSDAPDMTALLDGRLVLNEKCLIIQSEEARWTAIWPSGFSLVVQGQNIQILNGNRGIVARVGDTLRVGGGEIPQLPPEVFEANFSGSPTGCAAPYWVVGSIEAPQP